MLSIFPDLLIYSLLGTAILRIGLGFIIFLKGYEILRHPSRPLHPLLKEPALLQGIGALHIALGGLLLVGLYTQAVSLLIAGGSLIGLFLFRNNQGKRIALFLSLVISFSLLFLGAGYPAFDLPL